MRGRKSTKKARATPATIPARYYAIFTDLLRQMGVDIEPLLRAARIDESVLNDGDGLLTPAQVDALIAESAERTGRDDLGFELGRVIKLSSHDILGYGLLASPTLDYALDLGARYYRLISPLFSMIYTRGERHAEIALRPALAYLGVRMDSVRLRVHDAAFELRIDSKATQTSKPALGAAKQALHVWIGFGLLGFALLQVFPGWAFLASLSWGAGLLLGAWQLRRGMVSGRAMLAGQLALALAMLAQSDKLVLPPAEAT